MSPAGARHPHPGCSDFIRDSARPEPASLCVPGVQATLSGTDQPIARGGGGVTAWLKAVVQEQGHHLLTWAPGLARASARTQGGPMSPWWLHAPRRPREPTLRPAHGLWGRASPCPARFCGPLPGARVGWAGPPRALLLAAVWEPPLSPPPLSLPTGGRHLGQRVCCEPGMARWCSVCLGVTREACGPPGSGWGPSSGQGRLLLRHPTTGVPWLASSSPPSQQVLILIFQAQVAKGF